MRSRVPLLKGPDLAWRRMARACAREQHDALVKSADALHRIEAGPPAEGGPPPASLRVIAWNAERLKQVEASADLLGRLDPDVILLSEVDLGMARSGNRRNAAALAALLDMSWVYGAEYVELGLGDQDEQHAHAGADNVEGLHGGAIVARLPILDPVLIRLECDSAWFTGERKGQPRVGGRIALAARIETAGGPIGMVATHLESQSDPDHRASQMRTLLVALDQVDQALPWVIGGDLNTCTVSGATKAEPRWQHRLTAAAADRLIDPVGHEPLFDVARAHRYVWQDANALRVPTQRRHAGEAERPLGKLDWFLVRDLACADPFTIPAIGRNGRVLSDHELIALSVRRR